jgi:hypothetical protein
MLKVSSQPKCPECDQIVILKAKIAEANKILDTIEPAYCYYSLEPFCNDDNCEDCLMQQITNLRSQLNDT